MSEMIMKITRSDGTLLFEGDRYEGINALFQSLKEMAGKKQEPSKPTPKEDGSIDKAAPRG